MSDVTMKKNGLFMRMFMHKFKSLLIYTQKPKISRKKN